MILFNLDHNAIIISIYACYHFHENPNESTVTVAVSNNAQVHKGVVTLGAIMHHRLSTLSLCAQLPSAIAPHPYTTQYNTTTVYVFLYVVEALQQLHTCTTITIHRFTV